MNVKRERNSLSAKAVLAALKEDKFTPTSLAGDIKIIFDDYFVCGSEMKKNGVIDVAFLNGQKFKIKVKEVR